MEALAQKSRVAIAPITRESQATKFAICALLLQASCDEGRASDDLRIDADVIGDEISVVIRNDANQDKELISPSRSLVAGFQYGMRIDVRNSEGKLIAACAMVEPGNHDGADDVVVLRPGETVDQKHSIETIKRRYCLASGKHSLTFTLVQPGSDYSSNPIALRTN